MISRDRKPILTSLAQRLAHAWEISGIIETPAEDEVPQNRSEAYFTQDRMAEFIGMETSGWKIGATSARMREIDGHDDIIPGRLFPAITYFSTQLSMPIGDCPNPRVETEFGFRLNADMPSREAPWTAEEAARIITLHPALEVIGNRFSMPDTPAPTLSLMGIADNGGGIAGVFGDAVEDWQGVDYHHHPVSFVVDNHPASENFLGELRCDPRQAVADLANLLAPRGLSLKKGDMLLTGAATVPQAVQKGSHVVADFGELGRIELDIT